MRPNLPRHLLLLALLGCAQDDPAPLFLKIDYQVRCLDCDPRTADDPAHELRAVNGSAGLRVSCSSDTLDGLRTFNVEVSSSERQSNGAEGYSLAIRQAAVGDDPGSACHVLAREGANSYDGRCAAEPPSPEIPCQVAVRMEQGVLLGSVLCDRIPNLATTALWRSLVKPRTHEPAEFEAHGCPDS